MARTPNAARPGPTAGAVARPGRIRTFGPVAVLALPLALGLLAGLVLAAWPCSGTGCAQPYAGAWGLVLVAVPTALALGLPWLANPVNVALALLTSAFLWVTFGRWASRRATRDVDATWWSFWKEVAVYAAGIAVGLGLGGLVMLVVITLV